MSEFWSVWVIVLAVRDARHQPVSVPMGLRMRIPTQADGTTGHDWDGIREGVRKLPWWWIADLRRRLSSRRSATWRCIRASAASEGLLGWTSQDQLQRDAAANDAKLEALVKPWRALTIEQLATKTEAVGIGHTPLSRTTAPPATAARRSATRRWARLISRTPIWQYGGDGEVDPDEHPRWPQRHDAALGRCAGSRRRERSRCLCAEPAVAVKPRQIWVAAGKKRFRHHCASPVTAPTGTAILRWAHPTWPMRVWLYGRRLRELSRPAFAMAAAGVMPAWRSRLSDDAGPADRRVGGRAGPSVNRRRAN